MLDVVPTDLTLNGTAVDLTDLFDRVRSEVTWHKMMHKGGAVPRLVAMQGEFMRDGSTHGSGTCIAEPIYRHPADEQVRKRGEEARGEAR